MPLEAINELLPSGLCEWAVGNRDLVFVILPQIAHVGRPADSRLAREPFAAEILHRFPHQRPQASVEICQIGVIGLNQMRPGLVNADVGQERPKGRTETRVRRDQRGACAYHSRDRGRV